MTKLVFEPSKLQVHAVVDDFLIDLDEHTVEGHLKNLVRLKKNHLDLVQVVRILAKHVAHECHLMKGLLAEEIKDV